VLITMVETYPLTNRRLGREWFGTSSFNHPSPASPAILQSLFPNIVHSDPEQHYSPEVIPSSHGETIIQLHDRLATTLAAIIARVDSEVEIFEALQPHSSPMARSSKAIMICSHAAPLIAMGRALTGYMPEDPDEEDFKVFTTGLSTFVRRKRPTVIRSRSGSGDREGNLVTGTSSEQAGEDVIGRLAPGTKVGGPHIKVPDWTEGKGVGGGWDCISNSDCGFLSGGEERGWLVLFKLLYSISYFLLPFLPDPFSSTSLTIHPRHFNGEESFDTVVTNPHTAVTSPTISGHDLSSSLTGPSKL
jgi:transcription factor C subunit 7